MPAVSREPQRQASIRTFGRRAIGSARRRSRIRRARLSEPTLWRTYEQFAQATMVPPDLYMANLRLALHVADLQGVVVECGVWRGGMIAGIAKMLGPARDYILFDSFEGLPPAQQVDGPAAIAWQQDTTSPSYHDNCRAEIEAARSAMSVAGIPNPDLRKGWFQDTVPLFAQLEPPIALLRLDGDWFDSTMVCLQNLFPLVVEGGIIIIDDYGVWDGCTKAVHRYLSEQARPEPLRQTGEGVAFLRKVAADPA